MHALLGTWYWHYFQQNRWRFMQRTATAAPPGKDFTTWDLPRLFAEIDKHFSASLTAEKQLQTSPIATWTELLQPGSVDDAYRPTLYDFLVHEALGFYSAEEQAAAKAEDAFDLSADSPGPTDAAGAVVSGDSLQRAQHLGLDPGVFLRNNDAYHFFEVLGDLLKPGPTMTNVNDLTFIYID